MITETKVYLEEIKINTHFLIWSKKFEKTSNEDPKKSKFHAFFDTKCKHFEYYCQLSLYQGNSSKPEKKASMKRCCGLEISSFSKSKILKSLFLILVYFIFNITKFMQLFTKKSKLTTTVFPFLKNVQAFSLFGTNIRQQPLANVTIKNYEKLLKGDEMGALPKLPSSKLLNKMRVKQISKIMVYNHELNHEQVFQSHIECFYSIITKNEPPIESMALLLQQIYKVLIALNSQFAEVKSYAQNRALTAVMKPTLLKKLVQIALVIEPYYNEFLKIMIIVFINKALLFSQSKQLLKRQQLKKLQNLQHQVQQKGKQLFTPQGVKISLDQLPEYFSNKKTEIEIQYPSLALQDFLFGSLYALSNQYYSENLLQLIADKIENQGLKDKDDLVLSILKIKVLGNLYKFQNFKAIQSKKSELFGRIYNENVERYFNILQAQKEFFQILNSEEEIIQTQLVLTQFITNEHFNRAKEVYLNLLSNMFEIHSNGCLFLDIKKIRCIFEIILAMFNYKDTKKIHQFLQKVEKAIILYPVSRMEKLETLSNVCQKFAYKSDSIAERFLNHLLRSKEKLENLKGIIPHIHQYTRQLNLARKFLTYLQIVQKAPKDQLQLANKSLSQLFDPNIWYCLTQIQSYSLSYFGSPSFNNYLYFSKNSIKNLTSGHQQKKRIEGMMNKMNLRNINKKHGQILHEIHDNLRLIPTKLVHFSFWRHNHLSRMASTLKLACHHYRYLSRRNTQQAYSFLDQFLKKTINNTHFYNSFKHAIAYPNIFDDMLYLTQTVNAKNFPIQVRDLQALKKLYSLNLQKLKKAEEKQLSKETQKIKYQEFIDHIQYNRIYLPYNQQYYGLTGITAKLQTSILYDSICRYKEQKQNLKMQIETFCKFRKENEIEIVLNYLEYPHIADVYVKAKEKVFVILLRLLDNPEHIILNFKHIEMQKAAQEHWRKKDFMVFYIKSKKEIEEFVDLKIKETFEKLNQEKI